MITINDVKVGDILEFRYPGAHMIVIVFGAAINSADILYLECRVMHWDDNHSSKDMFMEYWHVHHSELQYLLSINGEEIHHDNLLHK